MTRMTADRPAWMPAPDCTECRIGLLTEPCKPDDVRRIYSSDGDVMPIVRPYRNNVVYGEGPMPCPLVGVGEGPGFHEDREGFPFRPSAPAGRELMKALKEANITRWSALYETPLLPEYGAVIYLTNVVKCRPLDNKIKNFPDGVEYCSEHYLFPELDAVQPKAIVAFGLVPAALWFGKHDRAYRQLPSGVVVLHAPHPSSIARGNRGAFDRLVKVLKDARDIAYG